MLQTKGSSYIYFSTVQLYYSHSFVAKITIHTSTQNANVSLAQYFQKHLSNASLKHGCLDQWKQKKLSINQNWKYIDVQNNEDVEDQYVKVTVSQTSFLRFHFVVYTKNHIVYSGLVSIITCVFDPKLVHATCVIHCIPCGNLQCTPMLNLQWNPVVPPHQQPRYQPVKYLIY